MSTAAKNAGLAAQNKKISNHSVRKTSISRLLDAGVPENFVMQLSGHKNLQILSSYKSASITHQRHMSHTLSRGSMSNNGTTSIREKIFHISLFSAESQTGSTPNLPSEFCQGQSFFAGATISTMNNCVLISFHQARQSAHALMIRSRGCFTFKCGLQDSCGSFPFLYTYRTLSFEEVLNFS